MTGERHAIPRHEQGLGGLDHGVAGGIAAGEQPIARRFADRPRCESIEPRGRWPVTRSRHLSTADSAHGRRHPSRLLHESLGRRAVIRADRGNGPHQRERRLPCWVAAGGESLEPRRSGAGIIGLERRLRGDHSRPSPRGRGEPASGHGDHAGGVFAGNRIGQRTVGPTAAEE
jgi:hypothetical protein